MIDSQEYGPGTPGTPDVHIIPEDVFSQDGNSLVRGDIKVEWVELGEGLSGDYDEDDPEDVELLRFDVSVLGNSEAFRSLDPRDYGWYVVPPIEDQEGNWFTFDDGSYCTLFPASADKELRMKGLAWLMKKLYDPAISGYVKHPAEEASWIEPGWVSKNGPEPEAEPEPNSPDTSPDVEAERE